jgi:hypothetical protein
VVDRYEYQVGGISGIGASKELQTSGDTGTFTFVAAGTTPYAAVAIAIKKGS